MRNVAILALSAILIARALLETLPALIDRKEAIRRVRYAISKLDNILFISQDEKATKIINPELSRSVEVKSRRNNRNNNKSCNCNKLIFFP